MRKGPKYSANRCYCKIYFSNINPCTMVDWVKRDVLSIWVTVRESWTYKCLVYTLPDLINTVYSFFKFACSNLARWWCVYAAIKWVVLLSRMWSSRLSNWWTATCAWAKFNLQGSLTPSSSPCWFINLESTPHSIEVAQQFHATVHVTNLNLNPFW